MWRVFCWRFRGGGCTEEAQATGCFLFTVHRHILRPSTKFQDTELWHQGQRQEGNLNLRLLDPAQGTKMGLMLFSLLHVGIAGMLGTTITRLSGQEGSDEEIFVNYTEEFRWVGHFQSQNYKACRGITSYANLTHKKSLICNWHTYKKKKKDYNN